MFTSRAWAAKVPLCADVEFHVRGRRRRSGTLRSMVLACVVPRQSAAVFRRACGVGDCTCRGVGDPAALQTALSFDRWPRRRSRLGEQFFRPHRGRELWTPAQTEGPVGLSLASLGLREVVRTARCWTRRSAFSVAGRAGELVLQRRHWCVPAPAACLRARRPNSPHTVMRQASAARMVAERVTGASAEPLPRSTCDARLAVLAYGTPVKGAQAAAGGSAGGGGGGGAGGTRAGRAHADHARSCRTPASGSRRQASSPGAGAWRVMSAGRSPAAPGGGRGGDRSPPLPRRRWGRAGGAAAGGATRRGRGAASPGGSGPRSAKAELERQRLCCYRPVWSVPHVAFFALGDRDGGGGSHVIDPRRDPRAARESGGSDAIDAIPPPMARPSRRRPRPPRRATACRDAMSASTPASRRRSTGSPRCASASPSPSASSRPSASCRGRERSRSAAADRRRPPPRRRRSSSKTKQYTGGNVRGAQRAAAGCFGARSNSVRCRRVARVRSSTTPRWTATCWWRRRRPIGPRNRPRASCPSRATFWRSWRKALAARSVVASGCVATATRRRNSSRWFLLLVLLVRFVRRAASRVVGCCAEGQGRLFAIFFEVCDFDGGQALGFLVSQSRMWSDAHARQRRLLPRRGRLGVTDRRRPPSRRRRPPRRPRRRR